MFFRKKPCAETIKPFDPEVEAAKKQTRKAAEAAKQNTDRLNRVFAENGITLNILRIAGGRHGG